MSEKILEIKDERLSFFTPAGEVKALNGVSFSMNQGDVLGITGSTGNSTGPHLHFEITENGTRINTLKYLTGYVLAG